MGGTTHYEPLTVLQVKSHAAMWRRFLPFIICRGPRCHPDVATARTFALVAVSTSATTNAGNSNVIFESLNRFMLHLPFCPLGT